MTLTWTRNAGTGNYVAFGDGGWFYLVGRLDRGWFLEGGPVADPKITDTSYGHRTRGDAYREAEEQEDVAGLLTGRYGLTRQAAADALAKARTSTSPVDVPVGGQTVRIATDDGGYTIDLEETP